MIYVGQPYTHTDPLVRAARAKCAKEVAWALMQKKVLVYAPIVYGFALDTNQELGAEYWLTHDLLLLRNATGLLILTLAGWKESAGLKREVVAAKVLGIPILSPAYFDLPVPSTGVDYDPAAWYGGKSFFEHVSSL